MQSSKTVAFLAGVIAMAIVGLSLVVGLEMIRRLWVVAKTLPFWVIVVAFVVLAGILGLFYEKNSEAKTEKDLME